MDSRYSLIYPGVLILSLFCFPCLITAQQAYSRNNCQNTSLSYRGYTCNGVNKTCTSFLIYRAQPAYSNISSIASLFSANASQISAISNISETITLPTNTEVIIPITCLCSGTFYQHNSTYVVHSDDNYYSIATNTFEGLTTCGAVRNNKVSPNIVNISPNEKLTIPVRCACPTRKQVGEGINYLMSFVIQSGNSFSDISTKFGADVNQTLEANNKTEQDSVIYPFTSLLVPLRTPPNGSELSLFPATPSSSPSPPPPSSSLSPSLYPPRRSSDKKWAYFGTGIVVGGAFVLLACALMVFIFLRRDKKKKMDSIVPLSPSFAAAERAVIESDGSFEFLKSISNIASLKVYSLKDLQEATANFSSNNWIKGSVYKGVITGGDDVVAIKKMDGDVRMEISVLYKINHFNLNRLLGVCFHDGIWYLVSEYECNGTLSNWIYHENPGQKTLTWLTRIKVAVDVATGLNYLHSYTMPPHVHKDISSNNILLDGELRAKIAKVGLSRPIRGNSGHFTLTKHIVGTKGYLAPEYLENGLVTPMLDVYSFGVLLLEMLTGKDAARLHEGVKVYLSEVLAPLLDNNRNNVKLKGFMDPSLGELYPEDVAMSMVLLVDQCLRKEPGSRPSMDEILQILSKILTTSVVWESSSASSSSS